jgi:hypothetical protein
MRLWFTEEKVCGPSFGKKKICTSNSECYPYPELKWRPSFCGSGSAKKCSQHDNIQSHRIVIAIANELELKCSVLLINSFLWSKKMPNYRHMRLNADQVCMIKRIIKQSLGNYFPHLLHGRGIVYSFPSEGSPLPQDNRP